jgi:hypothetical protein
MMQLFFSFFFSFFFFFLLCGACRMHEICRRLRLRPGMTMLDIGCGWGTLARFAEKHYGARVTAVTLSEEGAKCVVLPARFYLHFCLSALDDVFLCLQNVF